MPFGENTTVEVERVATAVVDSAYKFHFTLGPGLLEPAYAVCLTHELRSRGFTVEREVPVPVVDDGVVLETEFRMDLLVNSLVVVELMAVAELHPVFKAQLMTHLRPAVKRLGCPIDFNVQFTKDGLRRVVN